MSRFTNTMPKRARTAVIAAGNSGRNSITRLLQNNTYLADFILVDTDPTVIYEEMQKDNPKFESIFLLDKQAPIPNDMQGTNGNTALGEEATRSTIDQIKSVIEPYDLLFLIGGLGGGTASAALPIIAQAATELNIITIALVSSPFGFEALERHRIAYESIIALNTLADTLLVMHGDDLLKIANTRIHLEKAWEMADDFRHRCIHIVEQLTQYTDVINIDFADLTRIMNGKGAALFTMGVGRGVGKTKRALEAALICPWLNRSVIGAQNVLMHIVVPPNQTFFNIADVTHHVTQMIGSQTEIIWGVSEDPDLDDEIQFIVIATGFDEMTQVTHTTNPFMRNALDNKHESYSLKDYYWNGARS